MKVEFQNSVVRLSFLCHVTIIKIAWINTCYQLLNSLNYVNFSLLEFPLYEASPFPCNSLQ